MTVVSNASPLIGLARAGLLALLPALYGEVVLPKAVWNEVVVRGAGQPGAQEIEAADWIRVRPVENRRLVLALGMELGAGEAEAIALAPEVDAALLLMDERLGRDAAEHLGLQCAGVLGVLIEAKQRGVVTSLRPHLDALRDVAGFRFGNDLYARALRDAGEV